MNADPFAIDHEFSWDQMFRGFLPDMPLRFGKTDQPQAVTRKP